MFINEVDVIMYYDAERITNIKGFNVKGVSYIGAPISNTAMFVSKKVDRLIGSLNMVNNCLVFAESGIEVPQDILDKHAFVFSSNPQMMYAEFTEQMYYEIEKEESSVGFKTLPNGAYISNTAQIGNNAVIESGVVIGPNVIIGDNCRIFAGAIIKNSIIGNNVIINECSVIGSNGFTLAVGDDGKRIKIYSLGRSIIGNDVEIGNHSSISRGTAGDTLIDDYVKIDALVRVGHDSHIHNNVEICSGVIIGGYADVCEDSCLGMKSVIRNRIVIGKNAFVGMGSVVTKSIDDGVTVIGNPAKPLLRDNT